MIETARRSAGLSQRALGKTAGVSQTHVREIENGTRNATDDMLDKLASVLKLDASRLRRANAKRKLAALRARIAELNEVSR